MKLKSIACLLVVALLPSAVLANDYVSEDSTDWFRYMNANPAALQEVNSSVQLESGGWRLWDNFGGFGQAWVYSDPSHDWLWVYKPGQSQVALIGNMGLSNGWSYTGQIDSINNGRMTTTRGHTVTTPAGTFTNVSKVEFQTQGADAGVMEMWFGKDVGIVKWIEQSIAGPRTFELSTAMVSGQMLPATAPPPVTPPVQPPAPTVTVAPAEWEDCEVMLWGCRDTYLAMDVYEDSFKALDGQSPRIVSDVSVDSQTVIAQLRYDLTARNVPLADVEFYVVAIDSVWMRDYGPIILRNPQGQLVVGDMDYYAGRPNDGNFPQVYAQFRGWPRVYANLSFEGGNYISDGQGQLFTSTGPLTFNPGMTQTQVRNELFVLGGTSWDAFTPLAQEGTTHIDMFAKTLSTTTAIVSDYPAGHRQKPIVDAAASKLQGHGYTVTRLQAHVAHDEYATYANATLANGIALVPQYGNAALDQAAMQAYTNLGYQARPVNCRLIIQYGGAVHCISMQVPR